MHPTHEMVWDHFHKAGVHGDASDAARRTHHGIQQYGGHQPMRHWSANHACGDDRHGKRNGTTPAQAGDDSWGIQRAEKGAGAPSRVEPSVADGTGMKDAFAQRRSDDDSRDHGAKK